MPELKRVFSKATMNKDADERVVPNGQYRDALNIEIATSEGAEVGTAQTLLGNTKRDQVYVSTDSYNSASIGLLPFNLQGPQLKSTVVASVANEATDKIYYLVSAADEYDSNDLHGEESGVSGSTSSNIAKDYILEYDTVTKRHYYVFVDIFKVYTDVQAINSAADVAAGSTSFHITAGVSVAIPPGVRVGMQVLSTATTPDTNGDSGLIVTAVSFNTANGDDGATAINRWKITTNKAHGFADNNVVKFVAPRVLNFSKHTIITGINILDDFIYWTDNEYEPKKISIPRSIAGTGGTVELIDGDATTPFEGNLDYYHTRLVKDKATYSDVVDRYQVVTNSNATLPVYVNESHVTVIKKAPTQPLELEMYRTSGKRITAEGIENPISATISQFAWVDDVSYTGEGSINDGELLEVNQNPTINFIDPVDYRVGDILLIASSESILSPTSFSDHSIRVEVIESPVTDPNQLDSNGFVVSILSISSGLTTSIQDWYVKLEDKRPMFENRFPRFSYRYKYQDGEYSTFAPWSQMAFLPDHYEYLPKKGYNLGMVNQLRGLSLRYYHHDEDIMPQDVVEIDLLYKESGKPNVYTVKTIKQSSTGEEWANLFANSTARGVFEITSDMIHAVVPSNQILRPWDNVPRKALAQEISANRLIYGNYLQNYTVLDEPIIKVSLDESVLEDIGYTYAAPSVKTMRKYQVGVVFSDKYGRETPVLTNKSAAITVTKDSSDRRGRLVCQLDSDLTNVPSWAEYFSYYIKEPSVEYYTMAMDRWYSAADGNVWLSFPSSERNKLDNETFIVLKKAHGTDVAVKDKARYRILAIENEAPDFIKTEKKSLGIVVDNPDGIIGSGGTGFPFQDTNYVIIANSQFEAIFGDQLHILTPDSLGIKLYGQGQQSAEYDVSRLIQLPGDNGTGDYRINLVGKFEEDADFVTTDDTFATAIDDLSLEIIEYEVENRPEFDGRFFVKIFKDKVLEQYVLTNSEEDYLVEEYQNIGYLNNNAMLGINQQTGVTNWETSPTQPVDSGAGGTYDNVDANFVAVGYDITGDENGVRNVTNTPLHPTEYLHHAFGSNDGGQSANFGIGSGPYYWGFNGLLSGFIASPWNQTQTSAFGGVSANLIDLSPWLALNDNHAGGVGSGNFNDHMARRFWEEVSNQRMFFIDACSAYSLTGRSNNAPGFGSSLGTQLDGDVWSNLGNALSEASGQSSGFEGDDDEGSLQTTVSSTNQGHGQPSRGIWGISEDRSFIDISWSGMGPNGANYAGNYNGGVGNWGDATNDGGVCHRLDQVSVPAGATSDAAADNEQFSDAWEFMQKLVTPGTKFRFGRDPDETVYTVLEDQFPTIIGGGQIGPGYQDQGPSNTFVNGTNRNHGVWGIRNYRTAGTYANKHQYLSSNLRQRWTLTVEPKIGSGVSGYSPTTGTGGYTFNNATDTFDPILGGIPRLLEDGTDNPDYRRALHHDLTDNDTIEILSSFTDNRTRGSFTDNPGVWETEPKESVELDIYYQASGLIPLKLNDDTNEEYLPIRNSGLNGTTFQTIGLDAQDANANEVFTTHTITNFQGQTITFTPAVPDLPGGTPSLVMLTEVLNQVRFTKRDSYSLTAVVNTDAGNISIGDTTLTLHGGSTTLDPSQKLFSQKHYLDWNNCWCFGNGVESDRVRDDYNAAQVDNGVKASSVLAGQLREERRKHGLIWSGIYNSNSGVNSTNQFIQAEKITKDLNPVYGSIQALLNRDTRLVMFCEDKILRGVTNKDALYNADGNPQLISSNSVVGDVTPYSGNYGISKNPESMAATPSTVYFTDVMRGKVLALYESGIQPISDTGMKDYFSDFMSTYIWRSLGTYDARKKEYNVTVSKKYTGYQVKPHQETTVSFSELSKGWTSFKSFYPQSGLSLNNGYYTFKSHLYEHHDNEVRNNFYGIAAGSQTVNNISPFATSNNTNGNSSITMLFNDAPESVKSFMTINYEGSQANIPVFTDVDDQNYFNGDYSNNEGLIDTDDVTDGEYFNLAAKTGWYMDNLTTNLQTCASVYFKNKEDKYFGYPSGDTTQHSSDCSDPSVLSNVDEAEFSVQGIGVASITHDTPSKGNAITITVSDNTTANNATTSWDTSGTLAIEDSHWDCTTATLCVTGGATIGSGVFVNLTISPITDGAFSQYPLSAANFEIEDAAAAGLVFTVDSDTNVTDVADLDKVTFSDNGIPGDPENTVNVRVDFEPTEAWPTADFTYFIDIDEKETAIGPHQRSFYLQTQYANWGTTYQANPVVTNIASPIVEGVVDAGTVLDFSDPTINEHSGTITEGSDTMVAEITFASTVGGDTSQYYYHIYPTISFENLGDYEGSYTGVITDEVTTQIGTAFLESLTGFKARIFYSPPISTPLFQDPDDMSQIIPGPHKAIIDFGLKEVHESVISGATDITNVTFPNDIGYEARSSMVQVHGASGATFRLYLAQATSTTNFTAANYYNFTTNLFQSAEIFTEGTIPANGVFTAEINFPTTLADTNYSLYVAGVNSATSGNAATLASRIPTAIGEKVIYKHGVRKMTVTPVTSVSANFGTINAANGSLLDINTPALYEGYEGRAKGHVSRHVTGGNSSVASTKVTLDQQLHGVSQGMLLMMPFNGNSVPHNTTVVSIRENIITLSASVTLPNNTNLVFRTNNNSLIPFNLTVLPGNGKILSIKDPSTVDYRTGFHIEGGSTQAKLTAATDAAAEVTVNSTRGIRVGMQVYGTGIVTTSNPLDTQVKTVDSATQVTLNETQTIADETVLSFSYTEDDPSLTGYDEFGGSSNLSVVHLQAAIDDGNLKLQGYITGDSVGKDSSTLDIFIDDLVNVS